jgi:hypothetical protein
LGNGLAGLAAKFTGVTNKIKDNEAALDALNKKEADAAKISGDSFAERAKAFISLKVAIDKESESLEKNVSIAAKAAKVVRERGDASLIAAKLTGDEVVALDAATQATLKNQQAIEGQVDAQKIEIGQLEAQRTKLAEAAGAQSLWSESRKEFFKNFDEDLAKKKADLDLTKAQAGAEAVAATQAALSAAAYRDNSGSLEDFKKRVDASREALEFMTRMMKEGLATQDGVDRATRNLAASQGLLKDAYDDATKALQRRQTALKESSGLAQQDIDLDRKKAETQRELSKITGQYTDELGASISSKELDVKQSKNKIEVSTEEVKILRQEAALKQEQLKTGDPLYAQKQREIDSILNAVKSKEKEGLIERENLKLLEIQYGYITGTLYQAAKGFGTVGNEAKTAADKINAFTEAGKKARDQSFTDSPFKSGSSASSGANAPSASTYQTGQAVNKPSYGNWEYVIYGQDINGYDSKGNRLPGGWKQLPGAAAIGDSVSNAKEQTAGGFDVTDPFGFGAAQRKRDAALAEAQAMEASKRSGPTFDTDTPGTLGRYEQNQTMGRYEVVFTNQKTGTSTTAYTGSVAQAQAFIDNLQRAFRDADGS